MKKLRLKNGTIFALTGDEIQERNKYVKFVLKIPEAMTLEELELNFLDSENTDIFYIQGEDGNTIQTITGYTKYRSLEKTKDVVFVKMGQPDWKEMYDELKVRVDQLVEGSKTT